jgi:uncharacterized protein (TIGR00730 family)
MNKTITVFGSSKPLPGEEEYEIAYNLGKQLGEAGFNVCSGGYQGIMDAVSKGAVESGKEAVGVTVDLFNALPSKHLTKQIECHTLFERIQKLVELGDAYVILTGGTGTMLELSVVWELVNKNLIDQKPILCNGVIWKPVIESLDKRMEFENREVGLVKWFETIDDIVDYLKDSF